MSDSNPSQINELGYSVIGTGPTTVVLLRGLGRWSDHWLGFDEQLAQKGFRVISIDNRGLGKSRHLTLENGVDIGLFAEDAASVLAREAPFGAHVIGTSLGGMIGLSLASRRPQLVRSLTLINSSLASSRKTRLTLRAMLALGRVALGFQSGYLKLAQSLLGTASKDETRQQLAARWSAIDVVSPLELKTIVKQLKAAKKFTGLAESAAVRCPVLVIKSAGDLFVDPENSDFIQKQIKGATISVHPHAGHELAFEDPVWLTTEITRFVNASL